MPRTMRVEYPGAIYHVMDWGDRREDIVPAAHQVDSSPGANWVFQGRQVGAPSLGAWPKQNHRRSSQSMCAARIRIYGFCMSLKWIAQRLEMGSWTCVSNLLNEPPQRYPQAQEVLPLCQ
jgi:hypothetical protein